MKRLDALGETDRSSLFAGVVLERAADATLQALVEEAAEECGVPIAAVTLILDRVQHFRAHVGLPAELAIAGAVDRDTSFCQLVVRDEGALEVNDAPHDERVPQELVERFGIRSYLGMPVQIDGKVVGALCVIDLRPRGFETDQREALQRLAERVTERLHILARSRPDTTEIATRPAFAELREALTPLHRDIGAARLAIAEITPLARVVEELDNAELDAGAALEVLVRAAEAAHRLEELNARMDAASRQLMSAAAALEGTMSARRGKVSLADLIQHASHLSHGVSAMAGGIRWPDVDPLVFVDVDRRIAITDLTALVVICCGLSHSRGSTGGLDVAVHHRPERVAVEVLVEGLDEGALRKALVPVLMAESGALRVSAGRAALELPR